MAHKPVGLAFFVFARATLALFLAAFVTIHSACAPKEPDVLRVGTNVWIGYEPLYLARNLGYYEGKNIKLVEYPSTTAVMRAYTNGVIEAAAMTIDEVLFMSERENDSSVILIMDFSNGADAVLAKPGINSIADLRGKRVGVETTALGAYMLTRSLESAGVSQKEVAVVPLEVNEHEKAFREGRLDAVVTFDPVRKKLLAEGAKIIFDSSRLPGEIVDVLCVRRSFLKKNGDAIKALVDGWFRALDRMKKDPLDAARRVAPREKIEPSEYLDLLKGIHIPSLDENRALLSGSDTSFINGSRKLARVMKENNLLLAPVDIFSIISDEAVR